MEVLWMIVVGLVAGALAKFFMPGDDPGGIIVTILLGIAGAITAGYLGRAVGWYQAGQAGPDRGNRRLDAAARDLSARPARSAHVVGRVPLQATRIAPIRVVARRG